jgi:hypothetical protein
MTALAALEEVGWLVFALALVPIAILAIGIPLALVVRLIIEVAQRW